ncbi:hypothetical protein C0989_004288 [Termitomyces sp. Mn162]|nr:hypothetical protein C0989_004288 [Termitomyces sp. Mn162]
MPPKAVPIAPDKMPIGFASRPSCPYASTNTSSLQASLDNFGLLKCSIKHDMNQAILAVLQFPLFMQAVIGCKCSTANDSSDIWAFFTFANAIILINNTCHEMQCKHELEEQKCCAKDQDIEMLGPSTLHSSKQKANTEIDGKHKPKKVKVTSSVSSETALLLLGQVDATLKAISLVDGNEPVPHKDLKKQHKAVELATQQQLHLLNLSLQTYKLITAHLTCLNKVLASPNVNLAGLLLDALNVSFESTPKESNIELATPSTAKSQSSLELPLTPTL